MSDRSRWDPEMRAYQEEAEAIAAKYPPVKLELPLEPHRAVNDAISLARGARGPEMAETTERWVAARGRRIYCRVHRPRTDRPLPALVYFHGGGWVWGSVDTHDSAARVARRGGRSRRRQRRLRAVARSEVSAGAGGMRRRGAPCRARGRGLGARSVAHPARRRFGGRQPRAWRRRCCCATPAGRSSPASSRPIRCATAASTRRAIRSSPPAMC